MAIPPEPLFTVLPNAALVVLAEVVAVVDNHDGTPTPPDAPPSSPVHIGSQRVRLKVSKTLKGEAAGEVEALKPIGAYALRVGNHGPFLLDDASPVRTILGRYGPDTYREADLLKALSPKP